MWIDYELYFNNWEKLNLVCNLRCHNFQMKNLKSRPRKILRCTDLLQSPRAGYHTLIDTTYPDSTVVLDQPWSNVIRYTSPCMAYYMLNQRSFDRRGNVGTMMANHHWSNVGPSFGPKLWSGP